MSETLAQYQERIRSREREDMRTILKTAYGQRFIYRWLEKAGVMHQSFVPGESDSTAFNEGRRSIGNALLAEVIEVKPEAFIEMTKKAKENEDERKRIQEKSVEETAY